MSSSPFLSKVVIATFVMVTFGMTVSATSGYVPCDENRQCKFGGRCWSDGMCHCVFNCRGSWKASLSEWYCAPKDIQRRPFRNLCELTAASCELQQPIPMVKFNRRKPKKHRCSGAEEPWELCPLAEDFMGPCGGNLAYDGNKDAGICIRDKATNISRCKCPNSWSGYDCQMRVLPLFKNLNKRQDNNEDISSATFPNVTAQLAYSFAAIFVTLVIVVIIAKWYLSGRLLNFSKNGIKNGEKIEQYDEAEDTSGQVHLSDVTVKLNANNEDCCSDNEALFQHNPNHEKNNNRESALVNFDKKSKSNPQVVYLKGPSSDNFYSHPLEIIVTAPSPMDENISPISGNKL